MFQGIAFAVAANQLVKAYYPYGIIVRNSVKVSPMTKLAWFGPMLAFYGWAAWANKERPRMGRPDYTDDEEV